MNEKYALASIMIHGQEKKNTTLNTKKESIRKYKFKQNAQLKILCLYAVMVEIENDKCHINRYFLGKLFVFASYTSHGPIGRT